MKTPAELWGEYQPRFAEAEKRDRQEQSLVFLVQPVRIGRFRICPLSLKRLLYLEAIESPFVGGNNMVGRIAVLQLLWVMHPNFSPSLWRGKLFIANNFFIKWKWYAEEIGVLIMESMAIMGNESEEAENEEAKAILGPDVKPQKKGNSLWVAQMVDGFASQYNWSLEEILNMPLFIVGVLGNAMAMRLSPDGTSSIQATRHLSEERASFLKESEELNGKSKSRV